MYTIVSIVIRLISCAIGLIILHACIKSAVRAAIREESGRDHVSQSILRTLRSIEKQLSKGGVQSLQIAERISNILAEEDASAVTGGALTAQLVSDLAWFSCSACGYSQRPNRKECLKCGAVFEENGEKAERP